MSRVNLEPGVRYIYQDDVHIIMKVLVDQKYLVANLSTGGEEVVTYESILFSWSQGELRFEIASSRAQTDAKLPLKTRYVEDDVADLPSRVQARTWERYELIRQLYDYHQIDDVVMLSRKMIEAFVVVYNHNVEKPVSARSLERHLRVFVASGGDIRSLIPQSRQQGGLGQGRLNERVEEIIGIVLEKYTAITQRTSTVDQVMTDIINKIVDENKFRASDEQLAIPSERTIRRRIKRVGSRQVLGRKLSRQEEQAASPVGQGPRPTRILERLEIDHTRLDFFVVDEQDGLPVGRPHITACIDKYSGVVPGWHIGFNHGGYESIMLCLQHAILPKPDYREVYQTKNRYDVYGMFEKLCIDQGKDFKSKDLQIALAELGIIREEMPEYTPWFKGSIERYFRRINQQLLKGKPGYTFGNVVQLGDYNAQKDAVISLSGFLEIFHIYMVDIYPHSWHRGVEAIPMKRWQENRAIYYPPFFEDAQALKIILLPSVERVLRSRGIEWQYNWYQAPELPRLLELYGSEKIRFKYDPNDMDVIYVRDRTSPTGWVRFYSNNPTYTRGLSFAKHELIRDHIKAQKQTVDHISLASAKAHVQQVIEREYFTTHKLRRRSRLKPFIDNPPPEEPSKPQPSLHQFDVMKDGDDILSLDTSGWSADYGLPVHRKDDSDD